MDFPVPCVPAIGTEDAARWRNPFPAPEGPFILNVSAIPLAWACTAASVVIASEASAPGATAYSRASIDDPARVERLGIAKGASPDLAIAPLIGGPLAAFAVYPGHVDVLADGAPMARWIPPDGLRIHGATLSATGELWLAASDGASLRLLAGSGRPIAFEERASFAQFAQVGKSWLALAVDAPAEGPVTVLIWGAGRFAACRDGAWIAHRAAPEAPYLPLEHEARHAHWREDPRVGACAPLFQPCWTAIAPFVVHCVGGLASLSVASAPEEATPRIEWTMLEQAHDARLVAVSGRGHLFAQGPRQGFWLPLATPAGMRHIEPPEDGPNCISAIALADGAAFLWSGRSAMIELFPAGEFGGVPEAQRIVQQPGADDGYFLSSRFPPQLCDGHLWIAGVAGARMKLWRFPVRAE
ncbi:hypothetical protein [Sphingomonas hengshuiensis]|uniref:Uncharacterized protein n=1 Tax=Sphingomonas hengshuiensis TaxID=1609977 RepID=A0A7U4LGA9_9SPHN|nr:hypothetical protein [Sphingomonas hengshuiensis]AJP72989.1 hypothetical protein TS85_16100 [Sphingomonas hengshuiensis]